MSVLTITPKFLYPHSRQFPFDEMAEKIVKALEMRNWKVPGIIVEFYTYGTGEEKYQMVQTIRGNDFMLRFCRPQGMLSSRKNNIAALSEVCIPKQDIEVFVDESGPVFYLYVGKNWEDDKEWFMNSIKVNSKLDKEPKRYLKYKGNTYKQRAKELIADSDIGREYSPKGNEPVSFNLEDKFNEFTKWLKENVFDYITAFPEAQILLPAKMEKLIPYKGHWKTIFGVCNSNEAVRIEIGKEDPSKLPPAYRYAEIGGGHRLVPLDVPCKGRFPKIANKGFCWCDVNPNISKDSKMKDISYHVRSSMWDAKYIVAISLKYSNEVYVADNTKYEETRQQIFQDIEPRDRLTNEELGDVLAARGGTIIPITEYKGDYKEPIVLIGRELDFDEIEWIAKV